MKRILTSTFFAITLLSATAAQAANAIVTTNLNLRTGPGTQYPVLGSIPNGSRVDVSGCTSGYGWCQVDYNGRFGWASSRYLALREGSVDNGSYGNDSFSNSAVAIGIPLIAGVIIGAAINDQPSYNHYPHHPHYRPHNNPHYRPHYRPNNQPGWGKPSNKPSRPTASSPSRPGYGQPSHPSASKPSRPSASKPSHSNRPGASKPSHSNRPVNSHNSSNKWKPQRP